ncbi:MAG: hypothetical protein ABSA75_11045 [Candidatus Bathyarchaeia archaeon]|jgi:hypothetical protein
MALSQSELEALILKAVLLFNRLRSPEITAKLVFVLPATVTVSFSGSFCYGCGILDYVEGFVQQFKALTNKADLEVGKTRQVSPRSFETNFILKSK